MVALTVYLQDSDHLDEMEDDRILDASSFVGNRIHCLESNADGFPMKKMSTSSFH